MGPIPALEHDADDAAVHAVASLWPNVRALLGDVRTNAMPRLKSSLQLQRCSPSAKEMRDYLTAVDTAKKPLEASGSAKKARHVIANWAEGSPDYLLTIRRKIVLIRQLLNDGPDGDGQEQILNLLEHTASPDLKLILGADGGIQHAELLDKFTSWKTELHRFYMRRYPDAYSAEVKGEQDVFGQREPAPQAPDRKLLESAEPTELPFSLVQFGDDIPKTTNPWRVTTQREMHPQEREAGRDTVKSWAVEVYGKYIPADAIKRAGAASLTYDPGENTQWEAFIVACMNLRQEKDRAVARAICDAEETSTAAFYERDSNAIQVHAKRDTPETLLHEVLHALSHERTQELGHYAMEGMTELFTRRVALKRKWRKGEKPIYLGGHYDLPYDAVQELAIAVGEDAIASAYFGGNLKALCEAMGGKAIFDAWNKAMEGRDNAPEATKILRRETPAPPVEGACT